MESFAGTSYIGRLCVRLIAFISGSKFLKSFIMHTIKAKMFGRGQDVFLLNTGLGNEETQRKVKELLHVATSTVLDDSGM